MAEENMMKLDPRNHLEIAARTWAIGNAREISGIVVDQVLNQTQAKVPVVDLIGMAEKYEERFLAAWLHRNLLEFTRAYMSDVEERELRVQRLLDDVMNTVPNPPLIKLG